MKTVKIRKKVKIILESVMKTVFYAKHAPSIPMLDPLPYLYLAWTNSYKNALRGAHSFDRNVCTKKCWRLRFIISHRKVQSCCCKINEAICSSMDEFHTIYYVFCETKISKLKLG